MAIPVAGLLAAIAVLRPQWVTEPTTRIVQHRTEFIEPAPFQFRLLNSDLQVGAGEAFSAEVEVVGDDLPSAVTIEAMGAARSRLIVETADRPGLLVDIVRTLKDLSLNVVSAEIDTIGPQASDTVYLTYRGAALNSSMNELVVNALTYYLSKKEVETDESY